MPRDMAVVVPARPRQPEGDDAVSRSIKVRHRFDEFVAEAVQYNGHNGRYINEWVEHRGGEPLGWTDGTSLRLGHRTIRVDDWIVGFLVAGGFRVLSPEEFEARFEQVPEPADEMTKSTSDGSFSIGATVWPGISKLIEEMGELGQVLGKLIATHGEIEHWDGSDLQRWLVDEIADVMAALQFVITANELDALWIDQRFRHKLGLFNKWHNEQGEIDRNGD